MNKLENAKPLLSIVITSYNTGRLNDIAELFDSIRAQTYPNIEIIYVIERLKELFRQIQEYATKNSLPNIRVIFSNSKLGASLARNLGIKEAKGDIIAFVDDDAILFPDWAEKMVGSYSCDESIIGVAGSVYPLWEDKSMNWFPKEFYWIISCTYQDSYPMLREIRSVWGANASFKREAFELSGFFREDLGPAGGIEGWKKGVSEDVELSLRIKKETRKRIVYDPRVKVLHKVRRYRLRWRFIITISYCIGSLMSELKKLLQSSKGTPGLREEHTLLRRIFTQLVPKTLKDLPFSPFVSVRKLLLIHVVLFCVTLGYCSTLF